MSAIQGRERAIDTLSVRNPSPTKPTHVKNEEKTVGDKKNARSQG